MERKYFQDRIEDFDPNIPAPKPNKKICLSCGIDHEKNNLCPAFFLIFFTNSN